MSQGPGGSDNIPLPGMPGGEPTPSPPTPPPAEPSPAPGGPAEGSELPVSNDRGGLLPQLAPGNVDSSAFREQAFTFITGRTASGALSGNRAAQLMAAFGPSSRDPSRPDVAAAARGLGVSPRSVQRWLAGAGISRQHATQLSTRARQAMTTKRGRARAARAAGLNTAPRGRNAINVNGVAGVVSSSDHNYRQRDSRVGIRPEDLERMQELWVEHGANGVAAFLHDHFDRHYVEDWHFQSIDQISWTQTAFYNE